MALSSPGSRLRRAWSHGVGGLVLASVAAAQCELQKVLAADGRPRAEFGVSLSVSATRSAIAAWRHDRLGAQAGAAYVFELEGPSWNEKARLLAADGAPGDLFGTAVSISGDKVVVAAVFDDDNGPSSGSAYVFEEQGGWKQTVKLLASDGAANDQFGFFAGISGDTTLVTARFDDDKGSDSGSAYIFEKRPAGWVETVKLLASDGAANDQFGYGCSISGSVCVISALFEDALGVDSGSAYVYEKPAGSWVETRKLVASDGQARDGFGASVSVDGDVIVVGAWGDDDNGVNAGAAYVYEKQAGSWVETGKLLAADGAAGDNFGTGVSVSGSEIVVGADKDDERGPQSGSAYVYRRVGSTWLQIEKLVPTDGTAGDEFGFQVAIGSGTALVGSRLDADLGIDSGSAYYFSIPGTQCPTLLGNRRVLSVAAGGTQLLEIRAGMALGGQTYIVLGTASGPFPGFRYGGFAFPLNPDGYLQTTLANPGGAPLVSGFGVLPANGTVTAAFTLPPGLGPALVDLEVHHAFATIDGSQNLTHVSNPLALRLVR